MHNRLITKEILAQLVEHKSPEKQVPQEQITYSHTGPGGEIDKWWLVMEDREAVWQIRELAGTDIRRKCVIFCYPRHAQRLPNYLELSLIAALVEHYDVYLWQGAATNLANATPITDSAFFWQVRGHCQQASQAEVKAVFNLQGKSADEYIVLDATNYLLLLSELKDFLALTNVDNREQFYFLAPTGMLKDSYTSNLNPQILDLCDTILGFTDAIQACDPSLIKSIIVDATDISLINLNRYPKLETVCIKGVEEWELDKLDQFKSITEKGLKLVFDRSAENLLTPALQLLPMSQRTSTSLVITKDDNEFILQSDLSPKLTELELSNIANSTLNLNHLIALENLTIRATNLSQLIVNECSQLKHLVIRLNNNHDLLLTRLDLSQCTQLETLSIVGESKLGLTALDLTSCKKLKSLELVGCEYLTTINTGTVNELQFLKIDSCPKVTIDIRSALMLKELIIEQGAAVMLPPSIIDRVEFSWFPVNFTFRAKKALIVCCRISALALASLNNCEQVELRNSSAATNGLVLDASQLIANYKPDNIDLAACPSLIDLKLYLVTQSAMHELRKCNLLRRLYLRLISPTKEYELFNLNTVEEIELNSFEVEHVSFRECPSVKKIILDVNQLKHLNFIDPCQVEELVLKLNGQSTLQADSLSKLPNLKRLKIKADMSLTLGLLPSSLEYLEILQSRDTSTSPQQTIDLSGCINLISLTIHDPNITITNLASCTRLERLSLSVGNEHLDLVMLKQLKYVWTGSKFTKTITCAGLTLLKRLHIGANQLEAVNLTGTQLAYLEILTGSDPVLIGLGPHNVPKQSHLKCSALSLAVTNAGPAPQYDSSPPVLGPHNVPKQSHLKCSAQSLVVTNAGPASQHDSPPLVLPSAFRKDFEDAIALLKQWQQLKLNERAQVSALAAAAVQTEECPPPRIVLDELTLQNEASSVSCFSKNEVGVISLDPRTGVQAVRKAKEDIKLQVIGAYKVQRSYLRWCIFDKVSWCNGPFMLSTMSPNCEIRQQTWQPYRDDDLSERQFNVEHNPQQVLALMEGHFNRNQRYALTSEFPQEKFQIIVNCKDADGAAVTGDLIWDPDHAQHYIRFTQRETKLPLKILYEVTQVPHYNYPPPADTLKQFPVEDLLPPEMITLLGEIIDQHPLLKDIYTLPDLSARYFALIDFCKNRIKQIELTEKNIDRIELLRQVLKQMAGTCRHKALVFTYLCRYLGLRVIMPTSEDHAFGNVLAANVDHPALVAWYRVDVGGGLGLDHTPAHVRTSQLETRATEERPEPQDTSSPPKPAKDEPQPEMLPNVQKEEAIAIEDEAETAPSIAQHSLFTPAIDYIYNRYRDAFRAAAKTATLDNFEQLFTPDQHALPPLIQLSSQQNIYNVYAALLAAKSNSGDQDKDVIFVNSASEFAYYLSPPMLTEKGERKKIAGPLDAILRNGGVIVVNWSNFPHNEIASFKSIIDTRPTLFGRDLADKCLIIGLDNHIPHKRCSSFKSRCQSLSIDTHLVLPQPDFPDTNLQNPLLVNLFKLSSWRKLLLGDIHFKGHDILLVDGPLKKAIIKNRPLVIENPPIDDADFELLRQRLLLEKRVFYNGAYHAIPSNFSLHLTTKQMASSLANVKLTLQTDYNDKREHIYLGLHNLHDCINQLQIKSTLAHDYPGYLENFDVKKEVFYITQNLPEADWQYLLHHIQKNPALKSKQFEFKLAPSVSIKNVASNKTSLPIENNIILSNDTDYCVLQLQREHQVNHPLIIDVSSQTTFSDLLAKIERLTNPTASEKINFNYTKSSLLKLLKSGRTLILNGPLSANLYQQLLPLLNRSTHLQLNAKRKTLAGQLISVQPSTQAAVYAYYQTRNFDLKDYLAELPSQQHALAQQIADFFQLAALLPHRGTGRPKVPQLSFTLLTRLIQYLHEKRLHPHNPIKGVFHYDYPVGSEDYAYLNVMAKCLFGDPHSEKIKTAKALTLLKKHAINHENLHKYLWRLLNCFNPKTLRCILGSPATNALIANAPYPSLTPEANNRLWQMLQSLQPTMQVTREQPLHVEKRLAQLETLLSDPKTPLIMLKGEAGTGKTYATAQLKTRADIQCYPGKANIIAWLRDPATAHYPILTLDEANRAGSGTLYFLKSFCRAIRENKTECYYLGERYPITAKHKIIATGNPESYAERYHHAELQTEGETIYFKQPDESYMADTVLREILAPLKFDNAQYLDKMLACLQAGRKINKSYYYSIRDVINAAERFVSVYKLFGNENNSLMILSYACLCEFAGTMSNESDLTQFEKKLADIFEMDHQILLQYKQRYAELLLPPVNTNDLFEISSEHPVPSEAATLLESLQHAFLTRDRVLSYERVGYHKHGLLIEGDPGIGKSTLIEDFLISQGLSKTHSDPEKRYYVVSASNEAAVYDVLRTAHSDGSVVLLDEINLDKHGEDYINDLLDNPAIGGEGFLLLASQNACDSAGRPSNSPAFLNRFHVHTNVPPYSTLALINIAKHWQLESPDKFVEAYRNCQAENEGENINMRTFYTLLKRFAPEIMVMVPTCST